MKHLLSVVALLFIVLIVTSTVSVAGDKGSRAQEISILAIPDELPQIEGGLQAVRNVIKYPPRARELRIEGFVFVSLIIDEQGNLVSAKVVKGNPIFTNATLESVKKLKFIPGKLKGKPVTSELFLPLNYRLN